MYNVFTTVEVYSDDPFEFNGFGIGSFNFPISIKKDILEKFENRTDAEAFVDKQMKELSNRLISEFGSDSVKIGKQDIYVSPRYTLFTFWIMDDTPNILKN